MKSLKLLFPIIIGFSILFVSCKTLNKKKNLDTLEPAVLQFYEQLKWFRAGLAKNYIAPALRPKFLDDVDIASRKLKISYIKIIRITPFHKNEKAVVRIRVVWHSTDEGIVHETVIQDSWKAFNSHWLKTKSKHISGKKVPWIF